MSKFFKSFLAFIFITLIPLSTAFAESSSVKPVFTAIGFASGNTVTIKITGADIDHAAIISSDQSWIGNMSSDSPSNWSYTVTDLAPETIYNFCIKASSINNGSNNSPPENVTWQSITATTQKIKTVYSLPDSNMMCLTFDDGYSENSIKTILDCLRENNVHATFFIIGKCLKNYPELWQQAITDGNEIAYHSMKHERLTDYTDQQIIADINQWNKTAKEILGDSYAVPKIARLPGGNGNNTQRIIKVFYNLGYTVIAWNSDTYTGVIKDSAENTSQKCADYVISMAKIGTISLQHFNSNDANSLPLYIKTLSQKYTLGKISDAIIANQNPA